MVGYRNDNKKQNVLKAINGRKFVKSHDRQLPKAARQIEEEEY